MPYFNIVAQTTENTVVTEYEPVKTRSGNYQSEAALEKEFIRMLTEQGYEYLTIHHEKDLIANLRIQLEKLNGYHFSETEWDRFFKDSIANQNEGIVEKTRKIQEDKMHPGYMDMMDDLTSKFPLSEPQIIGEQNQKDFISLFGAILRMRNLLSAFDEFAGKEMITERDLQDYGRVLDSGN